MARFNRLAIRDHAPWRAPIRLALLLGMIVAGGGAVYWLDLWPGAGARPAPAETRGAEPRPAAQLLERNRKLAAEVAVLRRQAQVRRETYAKVEADLERQGQRIAELEDELRFYRGIFSRSLKDETLGVHGLQLWPLEEEGVWAYRTVLTHMGKGDNVIEGSIAFRVRGALDGEARVVGGAALGKEASTPFRLKHFRQLEGVIRLPDGFEPTRVEVVVSAGDEGGVSVDQGYRWSEVVER